MPRIMLAGTGSGCGKTAMTCAVLGALVRRGLKVRAFKCGPDYIDPMFHARVTGLPAGNLDSFLLPKDVLIGLLARNSENSDCSVIEGAMGFYDGLKGGTAASSFEVAAMTRTPVVLVLNARGASMSLAAVVKGFMDFRKDSGITGVILNDAGESLYSYLKPVLEEETGIEVLGFMPRMEDCSLASRHLGLVTAGEVKDLDGVIKRLAAQAEKSVNLTRLLEAASRAPRLAARSPLDGIDFKHEHFRLAVAKDEAFCFYYSDALALLEQAGAELVFFSPLSDDFLPGNIQGLYLGGRYPELHIERLSSNVSMLGDIRDKISGGLPAIAESGGFLTLCGSLRTGEGTFRMSGVFENAGYMTRRLVRFGYAEMTARRPGLLAEQGRTLRCHEFHYSDSTDNGDGFAVVKPGGTVWDGVHTSPTLHAGFPHIHLCGEPMAAVKFAEVCCGTQSRALPKGRSPFGIPLQ